MTLDDMDLAIIEYLAKDGRISGRQLSTRLPLGEGAIRLRLQRLLDNVVSVKTLVNPRAVGFSIEVFMGIRVQPTYVAKVVDSLRGHGNVANVRPISGMFDVMAVTVFRSMQDLQVFLQEVLGEIEGVRDVQTTIYLERLLGHFANLPSTALMKADGNLSGIDNVDMKIITCLSEDGRMSIREVSERLLLSTLTVQRRMRKLMDSRVIAVRGTVSPKMLGFSVRATIGLKVDLRRLKSVAKVLATHQQFVGVVTGAGTLDIIVGGVFRSNADLDDVLRDFVHPIEGVREIHAFITLAEDHSKEGRVVPRMRLLTQLSAEVQNGPHWADPVLVGSH